MHKITQIKFEESQTDARCYALKYKKFIRKYALCYTNQIEKVVHWKRCTMLHKLDLRKQSPDRCMVLCKLDMRKQSSERLHSFTQIRSQKPSERCIVLLSLLGLLLKLVLFSMIIFHVYRIALTFANIIIGQSGDYMSYNCLSVAEALCILYYDRRSFDTM